jgi:hypothetical protein
LKLAAPACDVGFSQVLSILVRLALSRRFVTPTGKQESTSAHEFASCSLINPKADKPGKSELATIAPSEANETGPLPAPFVPDALNVSVPLWNVSPD